MLTVKEVLRDKVDLDIECVDRVYLNGSVKYLQMPGGVINFIREQRNWPIPSPQMLKKISEAFREGVKRFAAEQDIPCITFKKQDKKEQVAKEYRAQFQGQSGVVLIGKAQEKALGYKAQATRRGSRMWFKYSRQTVYVTHYYFYILDENFGLVFIVRCVATFRLKSRFVSMGTNELNNSYDEQALVLKHWIMGSLPVMILSVCKRFVTR